MKKEIKEISKALKKEIPFSITDDKLISLSLDISRNSDKKITKYINEFKEKHNLKLTSHTKNKFRNYLIGVSKEWVFENIAPENSSIIDDKDILNALQILKKGISLNRDKVVGTIKARLEINDYKTNNLKNYTKFFSEIERDKNQLLIFYLKPEENEQRLLSIIKNNIKNNYEKLSNYHNIVFIFEDDKNNKISWNLISKIAVFSEFFRSEKNFGVYNRQKNKKINEIFNFLKQNENIKLNKNLIIKLKSFYEKISYGFQFIDLFISKKGNIKILVLQKIQLDETAYPCPCCMETIVRGNSYPKLLMKSFECQNSNCPSRSKIGRGKRYDLLSVKRNLMLEINHKDDRVQLDFVKKFRRDIFDDKNFFEMVIKFYSWHKNNVLILTNFDKQIKNNLFNRSIKVEKLDRKTLSESHTDFEKMFDEIISNIKIVPKQPIRQDIFKMCSVYNGNSTNILSNISEKITGAITSPPYYNAREYAQWPTLMCYLVDMAINALAVYTKLENKSYYFYNIGDIVGQENIFISSQMSKRRLMLGFYSAIIFEKIGFKFIDNIIWDKGEVQSKRNSMQNLFPGYIKPINCYEHILIFSKSNNEIDLKSNYLYLDSVKKINSKGKNMLGHTAPYPEALVKIIFDYFDENGYLLDPFLGSGTTIISSNKCGHKAVGVELNEDYYKLALKRIKLTLSSLKLAE